MDAKLILRAMTLRGIGSYLHGARLEFHPLTILCGTNGSGKSTWFKALNSLKDSLNKDPAFPMTCGGVMFSADQLESTNARISFLGIFSEEMPIGFFDKSQEKEYGPPGSIGLQLEATTDFVLQKVTQRDVTPSAELQEFFWQGKCEQGTTFRIRIAHPRHCRPEDGGVPGLWDFVELQVNEQYVVRFKGDGYIKEYSDPYLVECSAGFLPQMSGVGSEKIIGIGTYRQRCDSFKPTAGILEEEDLRKFVETASLRIRELLKLMLDGFFHISAIRKPYTYDVENPSQFQLYIDEYEDEESPSEERVLIDSRNVGSEGQNAWPLEQYFGRNHMRVTDPKRPGMMGSIRFAGYISRWTETLLNTKIEGGNDREDELNSGYPDVQAGFLNQVKPDIEQLVFHRGSFDGQSFSMGGRLLHPCFLTEPQIPRSMSSGFHQLFPLIVQTGLMRKYEIMAVENPEVHLHPSLQLRVAEFLINQAKIGKWIIIETHSDLIIRRVLRAILEEQIGQAEVQIGFADIEKSEEFYDSYTKKNVTCHYSTLNPMEIDDRGRIKNWPSGFMDDDVRESQRLLDIMYGGPPEEMEDDE